MRYNMQSEGLFTKWIQIVKLVNLYKDGSPDADPITAKLSDSAEIKTIIDVLIF